MTKKRECRFRLNFYFDKVSSGASLTIAVSAHSREEAEKKTWEMLSRIREEYFLREEITMPHDVILVS